MALISGKYDHGEKAEMIQTYTRRRWIVTVLRRIVDVPQQERGGEEDNNHTGGNYTRENRESVGLNV